VKLPRRQFLHLAAVAALIGASRAAWGQSYPAHPVRWVVTAAAGGTADILARLLGAWLSERLGQQFVVENRTGAAGNIGTESVVRSPADGYTIHLTATSDAINATLYDKLGFSLLRDMAPVACLVRSPFVLVVNPSLPVKTVPELVAYAKAHPGAINFASGGTGFTTHIAGEMFKMMTGVNMVHVPYRGQAPALTDLLAGQVQLMFDPVVTSLGHIRDGRLRALAVTTPVRSDVLPDIPVVSDSVPGYEASIWFGVGAPSGTPAEIVGKLNAEINAGLADSRIKARLVDLGATPLPMTPADSGKFVADEVERWGKVVRAAHLKAS
jgi:tripartite-type tricarboxylate transporter receptor subunit TctC